MSVCLITIMHIEPHAAAAANMFRSLSEINLAFKLPPPQISVYMHNMKCGGRSDGCWRGDFGLSTGIKLFMLCRQLCIGYVCVCVCVCVYIYIQGPPVNRAIWQRCFSIFSLSGEGE
jgi:hypothetical protein